MQSTLIVFVLNFFSFAVGLSPNSLCIPQEKEFNRSKADVAFGSMQLKQLQLDRPDLTAILLGYPTVCSWLEECFSGKFVGERIYWDNRMPFSQKYAEYSTGDGAITTVRISERAELTGHDRLAVLLFEMHNMKQKSEIKRTYNRAIAGDLDAESFGLRCLEIEHAAMLECKDFLLKHSIPGDGNVSALEILKVESEFARFADRKRRDGTLTYFLEVYRDWVVFQQKQIELRP